jgi:lysophospholipase L1-like esterase
MKIKEKINLDMQGLIENGPITIVVFGDSVTHGAVAAGEINYETVYWNRLKQKINNLRAYVPVNVINAGIGGISAKASLGRIDKQVLSHNPDLIIVCFGLNDVNNPLEEYIESMEEIFDKGLKSGAEVIFMTPNMLNTSVAEDTPKEHFEYAIKTSKMQNEGRMDIYIESAVELAKKMGVKVCDCYKLWKKLSETQDITYLLANRINHPTKEMHELFAQSLYETIFEEFDVVAEANNNTMYEK